VQDESALRRFDELRFLFLEDPGRPGIFWFSGMKQSVSDRIVLISGDYSHFPKHFVQLCCSMSLVELREGVETFSAEKSLKAWQGRSYR
jgi:hypothetical protein